MTLVRMAQLPLIFIFISCLLVACGGGGGSTSAPPITNVPATNQSPTANAGDDQTVD
jgi:hypothetical protein